MRALGLALLLTLSVSACETDKPLRAKRILKPVLPKKRSRIKQCNALIQVINEAQKPLGKVAPQKPEDFAKLAERVDAAAEDVRSVFLTDGQLLQHQADYVALAKSLAASVRETGEALKGSDLEKMSAAAKKGSTFSGRDAKLVDAINRYCSGQ